MTRAEPIWAGHDAYTIGSLRAVTNCLIDVSITPTDYSASYNMIYITLHSVDGDALTTNNSQTTWVYPTSGND